MFLLCFFFLPPLFGDGNSGLYSSPFNYSISYGHGIDGCPLPLSPAISKKNLNSKIKLSITMPETLPVIRHVKVE